MVKKTKLSLILPTPAGLI